MTRGEWHETAWWLRERHPEWTQGQIAEACGVSQSAVTKVLNPERTKEHNRRDAVRPGRRAQKNAWDRAHKYKPCPYCTGQRGRNSTACEGCFLATADVRRTLAEGMWAAGWMTAEITSVLGVSLAYLGVRRLRDGWDLPHRRSPEQIERIRAGRWGVAA